MPHPLSFDFFGRTGLSLDVPGRCVPRREIADLHIFFRLTSLICRFEGISFVYRVNGQK